MTDRPVEDNGMPAEVDCNENLRGPHRVPAGGIVFLPASSRRGVGEYFTGKAVEEEVELPGPAL